MSISKDLFLAILSLDSYNRGYGAGISDGGADDIDGLGVANATIGTATIVVDNGTAAAQTAGFYAISYTVGAGVDDIATGTTVISYRGTDFNPTSDRWTDVVNGWALGAGDFRAPQLELSSQFLENVATKNGVVDADAAKNIILTGHSLGGGLAGVNSRLYGQQAMVFDNSPYLYATDLLIEYYARQQGLQDGSYGARPLDDIQLDYGDSTYN